MANVDNAYSFRFHSWKGGGTGAMPLHQVTTDSNVSVSLGDAIHLTTEGLAIVATAAHTALVGIAAEPITGAAGTRKSLLVIPAMDNVVFVGQCSGTAAITDIGEDVDLEGTTGAQEINENASSTDVFRIVGKKDGSEWGANAELLFIIRESQYTGTT